MSVRKNVSGMRSLPGFGGNQFPVWIPRTDVTCEGPDVGDVGHLFGIAVNHFAVFVTCHRNKFGLKPYGHLRIASAQLGGRDIRIVDRYEAALYCLATLFTLCDRALKAIIDLTSKKILQRPSIAFGVGIDD